MKKAIVFAPLFLLLISWNTNSHLDNKQKVKTKRITLLDYTIERSPMLIPANTNTTSDVSASKNEMTMDTVVRKFMFMYDNYGQLSTVKSCNLEKEKQTNPFQISMKVNAQKQLSTITLEDKTDKLELIHKDKLLHQIAHFDPEFNELVVNTFTYNEKQQPKQTQLGSVDNLSELIDVSFTYDDRQNVKQMKYSYGDYINYSYDTKKYCFGAQSYYYNPFYYLAIDWLIFTNYAPKNNIVKVEDMDSIISIDYTYNKEELPITAKVTRKAKADTQEISILNEYEFYYKEIAISVRE